MQIQDILTQFNYPFQDMGNYINFPAIWRGGDDTTSVAYYKDKQIAIDFVAGEKYGLKELIHTIIGDRSKAEEYIKGNQIVFDTIKVQEKLKIPETFDENVLQDIIPNYSYWVNRGISEETCKIFQGGLCMESAGILGKLKRRQILVIRNSQNKIVGFTGRAIDSDAYIKYKHLGVTKNWVWPCYLNHKIIKETKEIILVESPVCVMKCFDCGIKNVIALFGTECHFAVVNYLLKMNLKTIFISTNNELDSTNGGVGNKAALSIYGRLKKYFHPSQIKIHLPPCKDFATQECTKEKILKWYNERND